MQKIAALLFIAFPSILLLGQTSIPRQPTTVPVNRFGRLPMRFPPELVAPNAIPTAKLARTTCVYPSPATKSLSIRPCRLGPPKMRIMRPFNKIAPTVQPLAIREVR